MTTFLLGAMAMGCTIVAMFFLRFWRSSGDRLFLYFALSFLLEAANRATFALADFARDSSPFYFGIRLLSYLLILWAILEKNLRRPRGGGGAGPP
jgi:hypothetical protein